MRGIPSTAAIGLSIVAVVTLSACANPLDSLVEQVVGGGVESIIEGQLGEDVDINIPGVGGGASLPSSWPSDVPTPEGEIVFSLAAGSTHSATFLVRDQGVVDRLYGQLEGAGYSLTSDADFGGLVSRTYENDSRMIVVNVLPDEDSGGISIQYSITDKDQ